MQCPTFGALPSPRANCHALCCSVLRVLSQYCPLFHPYSPCQAVDLVMNDGGNWVVVAPTNSGKTVIFIELAT